MNFFTYIPHITYPTQLLKTLVAEDRWSLAQSRPNATAHMSTGFAVLRALVAHHARASHRARARTEHDGRRAQHRLRLPAHLQDRLTMIFAAWAQHRDYATQSASVDLIWHAVQLGWVQLSRATDGDETPAAVTAAAATPHKVDGTAQGGGQAPCRTAIMSATLHVLAKQLSPSALQLLFHLTSANYELLQEFFDAEIMCAALVSILRSKADTRIQAQGLHWLCHLLLTLQQQPAQASPTAQAPALFKQPGLLERAFGTMSADAFQELDAASAGKLAFLLEQLLQPHLNRRRDAEALSASVLCCIMRTVFTAVSAPRRGHLAQCQAPALQRILSAIEVLLSVAVGSASSLGDMEQLQRCFNDCTTGVLAAVESTAADGACQGSDWGSGEHWRPSLPQMAEACPTPSRTLAPRVKATRSFSLRLFPTFLPLAPSPLTLTLFHV